MIERLSITNLKCFRSVSLELRPLTILTGLNSVGKSTVLQALLLVEMARRGMSAVPLTGEFGLAMGDAQDVLNRDAETRHIDVATAGTGGSRAVYFDVPENDGALTLNVLPDSDVPTAGDRIGAYLSAERLGPRDALEISARTHEEIGVGHQGQYTAQVLVELDRHLVDDMRRVPSETPLPATLASQSEAWLARIVKPMQVAAGRVPGTGLATLRFREPTLGAEWVRPANVGFGLSYALPIIVAGLSVARSSLFVVENPEAHLHPAGQSLMGEFLARVAASGVQVLVETHSDHVINGVRRAASGGERVIGAEDVTIHFFGAQSRIVQINVTQSGGLTEWPQDFFDQIERDLTTISRSAART